MRCIEFREFRKNSLLGFAVVEFPSGLVMRDITLHEAGEKRWAAPPSRPHVDKGELVIDPKTNKPKYFPVIEFCDQKTRERWSNGVVACVGESQGW